MDAMAPGCPWWDMQLAWGKPNVDWCEATLCSWVNEPANAWSNLAYVAVALWCVWQWRATGNRSLARFAATTLFVGVASFAFHATNNFATQLLDFVGMYVLIFLLLAENLYRVGWLRKEQVGPVHLGLTVGCTLLVPVLRQVGFPYQFVVLGAVLAVVGTKVHLFRHRESREGYRDFWVAVGLMAAAAACAVLDVSRVWCEPGNHWLQGHAVWHVLSALALLFTARHYAQSMEGVAR